MKSTRFRQLARLAGWAVRQTRWPAPRYADVDQRFDHDLEPVVMSARRLDADTTPLFEAGKQHNLRLAAPAFDGLVLGPGQPLSFWRTLGRVTAERGYVSGMALEEGCIVPSLGGGLCLLSNALFELAVRSGWSIVERHGHSMEAVPPGPGRVWGLDATVAWPHVDLVIEPIAPTRLSVALVDGRLVVGGAAARAQRDTFVLCSEDDRIAHEAGERIRENRLIRRRLDPRGEHLGSDVVAVNRKRLLDSTERRRSCMSCGEVQCDRRARHLSRMVSA